MSSIFTKIIKRELPAYIVFENDNLIAFLDINPTVYGHTLLIPKIEIDYFFDIEEELLSEIIVTSKKISKALKKATSCERVALKVYGFDIPHAHVHLLPANGNACLDNSCHLQLSNQEFVYIANKIKEAYNSL